VRFSCPYLAGEVELTEEREKHAGDRHPELLPKIRDRIRMTLAEPHEVRRSARSADARLFSRWFDDIMENRGQGFGIRDSGTATIDMSLTLNCRLWTISLTY